MAENPEDKPNIAYLSGSENVYFSDLVRVTTNELGFRLAFCIRRFDDKDSVCQFQVAIPPKIAGSLAAVLLNHIVNYEKKYKTRLLPESVRYQEGAPPEHSESPARDGEEK